MANHQDRLARRQRANEELQARLAARNAAFDALDALDAALASVASVAAGAGDPVTRAEKVRVAMSKVESAVEDLRTSADELRISEHAKASEVAELLGVPAAKLVRRQTQPVGQARFDSPILGGEQRRVAAESGDHTAAE